MTEQRQCSHRQKLGIEALLITYSSGSVGCIDQVHKWLLYFSDNCFGCQEQGRSMEHWEGARDLAGCCEPVQWFFYQWFGCHLS